MFSHFTMIKTYIYIDINTEKNYVHKNELIDVLTDLSNWVCLDQKWPYALSILKHHMSWKPNQMLVLYSVLVYFIHGSIKDVHIVNLKLCTLT